MVHLGLPFSGLVRLVPIGYRRFSISIASTIPFIHSGRVHCGVHSSTWEDTGCRPEEDDRYLPVGTRLPYAAVRALPPPPQDWAVVGLGVQDTAHGAIPHTPKLGDPPGRRKLGVAWEDSGILRFCGEGGRLQHSVRATQYQHTRLGRPSADGGQWRNPDWVQFPPHIWWVGDQTFHRLRYDRAGQPKLHSHGDFAADYWWAACALRYLIPLRPLRSYRPFCLGQGCARGDSRWGWNASHSHPPAARGGGR